MWIYVLPAEQVKCSINDREEEMQIFPGVLIVSTKLHMAISLRLRKCTISFAILNGIYLHVTCDHFLWSTHEYEHPWVDLTHLSQVWKDKAGKGTAAVITRALHTRRIWAWVKSNMLKTFIVASWNERSIYRLSLAGVCILPLWSWPLSSRCCPP